MLDLFLFVGLPYLAVTVMVIGTIYRFTRQGFSVSSLSSQVLESRILPFGSVPWHMGIFVILGGHLLPFLFPDAWASFTSNHTALLTIEFIGMAAAVLCAVGLVVLLTRRLISPKLQRVTNKADLIILAILLIQVVLGIGVAMTQRWGAQWSTGTTTPYLWSLVTLSPEVTFVSEMPALIKIHLILAWAVFFAVPFSRLVHMFAIPIHYLFRPPQRVIWVNARRTEALVQEQGVDPDLNRRHLIHGAAGLSAAGVMMGVGTADKVARFFQGPELTKEQEAERLENKLKHLKMNAHERELELERLQNDEIFIARLNELDPKSGKYFTDYDMHPALALLDKDTKLPILLSARCTHLACTVGKDVDDEGRILCPCHVSYFDIHTGKPNSGAPAKDPLPRIPWLIKDPAGQIVMSQSASGKSEGTLDPAKFDTYSVYTPKKAS